MLSFFIHNLWLYIRPYKKKVFLAVFLAFLLALINGAQLKLITPFVDEIFREGQTYFHVIKYASLIILLGVLNFPCRFFHYYWVRSVCERIMYVIRHQLICKVQMLPTSYLEGTKRGNIFSVIMSDTFIFSEGLRGVLDAIREPFKIIIFLVVAFWSDWFLSLLILLVAPIWFLIFKKTTQAVTRKQFKVQEDMAELTHSISEVLDGYKVIKTFNLRNFIIQRLQRIQSLFLNSQMSAIRSQEISSPQTEFVTSVAIALMMMGGWYRSQHGMTPGNFITFLGAIMFILDSIRRLNEANIRMSQAKAAFERINVLLNSEEEEDEGTLEVNSLQDEIEFKNVSFAYADEPVIKNLSLKIKKGKKVALVGSSGSGKTTITNLLLRLYSPDSGEILLNGHNLNSIKLTSLRQLFGLVEQDVFLFHEDILGNITLGQNFSEEKINEALQIAHADEFIEKLPKGRNTIIGDRGTLLSGGQKQRLTIARAFLSSPDVLVFDEATSALDNISERLIQDALAKIANHKTVIAIAHRLSTIRNFDYIYVLREGRLVEEGTHDSLMEKRGEYAKLYELSLSY